MSIFLGVCKFKSERRIDGGISTHVFVKQNEFGDLEEFKEKLVNLKIVQGEGIAFGNVEVEVYEKDEITIDSFYVFLKNKALMLNESGRCTIKIYIDSGLDLDEDKIDAMCEKYKEKVTNNGMRDLYSISSIHLTGRELHEVFLSYPVYYMMGIRYIDGEIYLPWLKRNAQKVSNGDY